MDVSIRQTPGQESLFGQYSTLRPMVWEQDLSEFYKSVVGNTNAHLWDYMSIGPFDDILMCHAEFHSAAKRGGWDVMTISAEGANDVKGTASFMRQRQAHGSVEIGFILYSAKLQRTRAATDAIYQMLKHLFEDLNYRRVEWKCNTQNEPSKRAAHRFGFKSEGVFRQDLIVKGRNRDTAWFSMLDSEWPLIKIRFENWLSPENFDDTGQQLSRLTTQ